MLNMAVNIAVIVRNWRS